MAIKNIRIKVVKWYKPKDYFDNLLYLKMTKHTLKTRRDSIFLILFERQFRSLTNHCPTWLSLFPKYLTLRLQASTSSKEHSCTSLSSLVQPKNYPQKETTLDEESHWLTLNSGTYDILMLIKFLVSYTIGINLYNYLSTYMSMGIQWSG